MRSNWKAWAPAARFSSSRRLSSGRRAYNAPVTHPAPEPDALMALLPWFAALSAGARAALAREFAAIALRSGDTLFDFGEPSDSLYVLTSGSLGAFAPGPDPKLIGQIVAGETVGELGLLTGRPRMATVRALRDSELLRLDRASFERLGREEPGALLAMSRLALERANAPPRERTTSAPRTLALLPQCEGVDVRAFAERFADALSTYGTCLVVDSALGSGRDTQWFNDLETSHRYVVYVGEAGRSAWRNLCLRQADALLFLADAGSSPAEWSEATTGLPTTLPRPEHLVLLHPGKPRFGSARRWAKQFPRARLHHVRGPSDVQRVARLVIGRSIGLVLSGGGARGFAHLGVIKALREAGIQIDAVGGTSIGAIIGAGVAADWSTEEMIEVYRRAFVVSNPLSDYTLPLISMVSGRKVSRLLRESFGEREIEDLALPFFCVSANLSSGKATVHREGRLWQWLRASVAIPGVLPPVFHGGQVYVDGGVINNLPVDIMQASHAPEVVAVDIGGDYALRVDFEEFDSPPWWRLAGALFGVGRSRPNVLRILLRAGMVNAGAATLAARESAALLIQPPLAGVDLLDWRAFDRAMELGYQHAVRVIGGPKDVLSLATPLIDL